MATTKVYAQYWLLWCTKVLFSGLNQFISQTKLAVCKCLNWNNGLSLKYLYFMDKFSVDLSFCSVLLSELRSFQKDIN
jgi:hypothetical protein